MKIPLIWLKDYVKTDKDAGSIAASFTQLGLMLDKPLDDSGVLDLEHRMDRSDWLSIIGCARDFAAFENIPLLLPKLPSKKGKAPIDTTRIQINVESSAVNRFQARVFKGVTVGPSPKWLAERLIAYGMSPINNIVDITNFVMVEYGQPMHAQDLAKLKGADITIRPAKSGEKLTTLLGTEVKLDPSTFVLTSGGEVTVIGGIVGGKNTGVTETTKDIILDSGNYDSRIVRKTSRKLKIINETVSRYDKFLDPRTIDLAMERATSLILELAGGEYYENGDYYPVPTMPKLMTLRLSRLTLLSGMSFTLSQAKKILKSLDYIVVEESDSSLTLELPPFRTDIEVEDDLVSDILRIYNYANIPQTPLASPVPKDITPSIYTFEDKLRDLLLAQGAHEHITNSLTSSSGKSEEVVLANALTSDQNALRTELASGLSHVLSTYKKHKLENISVFEIGKVFRLSENKYLEGRLLTVMGTSHSLSTLLSSLGILDFTITHQHEIMIGNSLVGSITPSSYTLVTNALLPHVKNYQGIISEYSHISVQDLSLLCPINLKYTDIKATLSTLKGEWQSITCKSMTKIDEDQNNYLLSVTWDSSSKEIEADKKLILSTLNSKLKITSKS